MAEYQNFDRQYRMAVGKGGQEGFEIGDISGSFGSPLHISFSIQKSDLETQNTARVEVWNLNDTHLADLEQENCILSLRAGYGDHMPLIFAGMVDFVSTEMDGADRKTTIEVIDNLIPLRESYVSVSYQGVVNWKKIFDDTAQQIGVAVQYSYNATFVDVQNGFSFVGKAKDIFAKGCACCGLEWSIQNGVLQIKNPGDAITTVAYSLSAESGLIGLPKRVAMSDEKGKGSNSSGSSGASGSTSSTGSSGSSESSGSSSSSGASSKSKKNKQLGWEVTYFLNGAINVNDYVALTSRAITGYFYVKTLEIAGDNVNGDWACRAQLIELTKTEGTTQATAPTVTMNSPVVGSGKKKDTKPAQRNPRNPTGGHAYTSTIVGPHGKSSTHMSEGGVIHGGGTGTDARNGPNGKSTVHSGSGWNRHGGGTGKSF